MAGRGGTRPYLNSYLQHMKSQRILYSTLALLTVAFTGATLRAGAQDQAPAVNPTGTWASRSFTSGSPPVGPQTLKLKWENGKLTGTLSRNAGNKVEQLPLEDGSLKGNEISFATHLYTLHYENNVLQPTDTNKVTHLKFHGVLSGDTIKGKIEKKSWLVQTNRTQEWEAKRVKSPTR
jgi:hypothetical protein